MKRKTNKSSEGNSDPLKDYVRYSNLFFQMAVIIAGGTFGGYYLDKSLKLSVPVFTIVLSFGSVVVAIYLFVKDIKRDK